MAKQNLKAAAKKTLAVISTVALLLSCGTTGLFTVNAAQIDGTTAPSAANTATKVYFYDQNGNDITNSPIIYLDNTSAAGQATSTLITVKMSNDKDVFNDSISYSVPQTSESDMHFSVSRVNDSINGNEHTCTVRVSACKYVSSKTTDPITKEPVETLKESPYKPGTDDITFFSTSGEVERKLKVVVLEPATDMKVYWGNNKNLALDLNDDTKSGDTSEDSNIMNNTTGASIVANHPIQLSASLISPNNKSTDEVEWSVYDGYFNKKYLDAGFEALPTTKAEIDESGYFTPKENGIVTIVANFKATERASREYEMALNNYKAGKLTEEPVFVSDRQDTIGNKTRSVRNALTATFFNEYYTLGYDVNGHLLYDSNTPIKNITSNKKAVMTYTGDYKVTKTTIMSPYPVVQKVDEKTGLVTYTKDEKNGSVMPIDIYKPVYNDIKTVPKYINVVIIKENPATKMTFSKTTSALEIGETFQMELNVVPTYSGAGYESGATDIYTWTSSNPQIASVDQNGVVTALRKGDVKITATAENKNVSTSCNITVLTKAKSISIEPSPTSTRVDVSAELTATMSPIDANDEIIWESADPDIAEVVPSTTGQLSNPQKAIVTGKSEGFTEIIARAKNSGAEAARCRVTVEKKTLSDNLVISTNDGEKITPVPEDSTLTVYTTRELNIDAELTAADGLTPDDKVKWEISNNENDAVTVSSMSSTNIKLKGNTEGTIKVTAYSEANPDTVKKSFYVEVLRKCDTITILDSNNTSISSKNINVNNTLSLSADLKINGNYPYNHKDTVKSWSSSDPTVATVNNNGTVEALKVGKTNITVTTSSGQTKSITVNVFITSSVTIGGVTASVDGIELPTATVEIGSTKTFYVTVRNQENSTVSGVDCEWTSSDENVAAISNTGKITTNNVGTTIITVKSGAQTESCLLTVTAKLGTVQSDEIPAYTYSPNVEAYEPEVVLVLNGNVLTENVDYTLEYLNNTSVGTARIRATGIGNYTGTKEVQFKIVAKQLTESDVKISTIKDQECTGKALTPDVTVTYENVTLQPGTDYTVTYKNNTKPTTTEQPAQVTLTGKGNYTGTAIQTFNIYCDHKELKNVKITKEPTYKETGLQEGICTICGEKVTTVVPIKKFLGIYGDVDNSGVVDSADALAILRKSVKLENFDELQLKLADVDQDGDITSSDALLVLRKSVGLEDAGSVAGQDYN